MEITRKKIQNTWIVSEKGPQGVCMRGKVGGTQFLLFIHQISWPST